MIIQIFWIAKIVDLPILPQEICGPILGIYKSLTDAHECGNWDWGGAIPRKDIQKWDFRCSAVKPDISQRT
jgi:hypothetical protein